MERYCTPKVLKTSILTLDLRWRRNYKCFLGVLSVIFVGYFGILKLNDVPKADEFSPQFINLVPPSTESLNLDFPNGWNGNNSWSEWQQDLFLWPLFEGVEDGFFVESGAATGEVHSNSLLYEVKKGWTGFLVEPNPNNIAEMLSKKRHVWIWNGCLSTSGMNEYLTFTFGHNWEAGSLNPKFNPNLVKKLLSQRRAKTATVMGASINTLMEKIGRKVIDFWSLDVEGVESMVLETTDFQSIEVGVMLIEMNRDAANNDRIRIIMQKNSFVQIGVTLAKFQVVDGVFVNPKYFKARGLSTPQELRVFNPQERQPKPNVHGRVI